MKQEPTPTSEVSPGTVLTRELEARGWTQKDLASIMGRPPQAINEIVRGTKQITPETALELAQALDMPAEFWANLQSSYQLALARRLWKQGRRREIARRSRLYTLAPVAELLRRGWVRATDSLDELEPEIYRFLGVSPEDLEGQALAEAPATYLPGLPRISLRLAKERGPAYSAQIAWLKRAEHLARAQAVAAYDPARLSQAIPGILACAAQAEEIARLPSLLARLGAHLLLVPVMPRTELDGAAFYVDGHPVVALTLRYDCIDAFWFSLLHGLAHIVRGQPGLYLDNLDATGLDYREADTSRQARDWLLNAAALAAFMRRAGPGFPRHDIERFASREGRHPGIVLGYLQREGLVGPDHLRVLLARVRPILKEWIDTAQGTTALTHCGPCP